MNAWGSQPLGFSKVDKNNFELTVELPVGQYAYQIVVDGHTLTPLQAKTYSADGFGGNNALLIVEQAESDINLLLP